MVTAYFSAIIQRYRFLNTLETFHVKEQSKQVLTAKLFRRLIIIARMAEQTLDTEKLSNILTDHKSNPDKLKAEIEKYINDVKPHLDEYLQYSNTLIETFSESLGLTDQLGKVMFQELLNWLKTLQNLSIAGKFVIPDKIEKSFSKSWSDLLNKAIKDINSELRDTKKAINNANKPRKNQKPGFFWGLRTNSVINYEGRILDKMFREKTFEKLIEVYQSLQEQIVNNRPDIDFFSNIDYLIKNYKYIEIAKAKLQRDILQQVTRYEDLTAGVTITLRKFAQLFQNNEHANDLLKEISDLETLNQALKTNLTNGGINEAKLRGDITNYKKAYKGILDSIGKKSSALLKDIEKNPYNR